MLEVNVIFNSSVRGRHRFSCHLRVLHPSIETRIDVLWDRDYLPLPSMQRPDPTLKTKDLTLERKMYYRHSDGLRNCRHVDATPLSGGTSSDLCQHTQNLASNNRYIAATPNLVL